MPTWNKGDEYVSTLVADIDIQSASRRSTWSDIHEFTVVLDGLRYASSAMENVAEYDNSRHEFGNCASTELLWKTKNGRWLLAGQGGGATPWDDGDADWFGYGFVILTPEQARKWCEVRHQQAEIIGKYFDVADA